MSFYAISDVHGMSYELKRLLDKLPLTKSDTLVFLGDVIDRGDNPRDVVQTILDLRNEGYHVETVMGNHEDVFISHLKRNSPNGGYGQYCYRNIRKGYYVDRNGGWNTLSSYGHNMEKIYEHLPYFKNLRLYYETKDYIFVHGGLKPRVPLHRQIKYNLLWLRYEFIDSSFNFGKTVVYGHTPVEYIHGQRGNKIGIDTGCCYGGELSCLRLPDFKVYQVRSKMSRSYRKNYHYDDWNHLWSMA